MDNFLRFYQHLPLYLDPTIGVGFFSVSWYSIMYLVGLGVAYCLLRYRLHELKTANQNLNLDKNLLVDFIIYAFIGLLIGARLGEVFFYNFSYYWANPIAIISPFDPVMHEFIGIYGMSYHGGLVGVLIAAFVFVKRYKLNFWSFSDFIVPAVPAGYFFGRIGNFINNELYGKITDKPWGMYFRDSLPMPYLRHPSQLYEAFLEGIVLFAVLWAIRNRKKYRSCFLAVYIIGYGAFRFVAECFREPDAAAGYICSYLTIGQVFSVTMIVAGVVIIVFQKNKKVV
jgi:phosphatidylglycerol---prolipoprotein diacylglyceryl transferase